MAEDEFPALRGSLSNRYRLDREIGRGGAAVVYAAWDLKHSRHVAIKVLRPEIPEVIGVDRFLREMRIAAGLQHPNIIGLLDSGEVNGRPYYVMPLVSGESLQDRLKREKQLPLDEALRITRNVAAALEFAHKHGVVHRDIKPANILISDSETVVADFGLARALAESAFAGEASLSTSGVVLGTLWYMSPEQAGGQAVDHRSDIYAMGCVLYEMLVGEPPFPGTDAHAILARHMSQAPSSVRIVRRGVPPFVDKAIMRALEKSPADRFQTAVDFASAVSAPGPGRLRLPSRLPFHRVVVVFMLAGLGVAAWGADRWQALQRSARGGVRADTSVYAVLPIQSSGEVPDIKGADQLLTDALERWSGIRLVERFQLVDALSRGGRGELTPERAASVARSVGAGRFIRTEVTLVADSLRIRGVLYDAEGTGTSVRQVTVRAGPTPSGLEAAMARVADELLFPGGTETAPLEPGTRSLPARQAFARGEAAFSEWDFDHADSGFAKALQFDSAYSRASARLALVRAWGRQPVEMWRRAAEEAARDRDRLPSAERSLVPPLVAQARGDFETACGRWREITVEDSLRFLGWYGLAICLVDDQAVLRSGSSASGWKFRTSYREAVRAYRRAFELSPTVLTSLRPEGFSAVRDLLFTRGDYRRRGRAVLPDTGVFLGHPSWESDTLCFVPFRALDLYETKPGSMSSTLQVAIAKQREVFLDIASTWSRATGSGDALEAVAIALQLLGQRSAVDSFHRARSLATRSEDRIRIAMAEAWYRIQLAVPYDTAALQSAKRLADSLLRTGRGEREPHLRGLAGLAALTGRGHLAARLYREAAVAGQNVAGQGAVLWPIADRATSLLAYSSMGGPADSLARLARDLEYSISHNLPAKIQKESREAWLERSATLAIPDNPSIASSALGTAGYPLLDAMLAHARGRREGNAKLYDKLREMRRLLAPEGVSIDALFPEAWLLGTERPPDAAAWLDPWFGAIYKVPPWELGNVPFAGAFVRAMMLRARLAVQLDDNAGAARWAKVVTILWSDADPYLQDAVRDMRNLTRREVE